MNRMVQWRGTELFLGFRGFCARAYLICRVRERLEHVKRPVSVLSVGFIYQVRVGCGFLGFGASVH